MKILIACEYSGRVRDAFIAAGHDAVSCDILPTDAPKDGTMTDKNKETQATTEYVKRPVDVLVKCLLRITR